jgi:hypothetical protein
MSEPFAEIGGDAQEAARVLIEVEAAAQQQAATGDVREGVGTPDLEIASLPDNTEVVRRVLAQMQRHGGLDLGEFDMASGAGPAGRLHTLVKKAVWKLLRFYTYRMFSQQRDFNRQTAAVLDAMWSRLDEMERRCKPPNPGAKQDR